MLIIATGIVRVVCQRKYHAGRDSEALFARAGIEVAFKHDEVQPYDKQ
jgi:dCMP deaminase